MKRNLMELERKFKVSPRLHPLNLILPVVTVVTRHLNKETEVPARVYLTNRGSTGSLKSHMIFNKHNTVFIHFSL